MTKTIQRYRNEDITTTIGEDTLVTGEMHTQNSLLVLGHFEGVIRAQGDVFVGEKSHVKGDIYAKRVVVSGEVTGNVATTHGLEIAKTGRVTGDVSGDRLIVEEGAIFKGKVNMDVISSRSIFVAETEPFSLSA